MVKLTYNLSLRDLETFLKDYLDDVPDFTTILYRFKQVDPQILHKAQQLLAKLVLDSLSAKEFYAIMADATF